MGIGLGDDSVFVAKMAFQIGLNNASNTSADTNDVRWFCRKNNISCVGLPRLLNCTKHLAAFRAVVI